MVSIKRFCVHLCLFLAVSIGLVHLAAAQQSDSSFINAIANNSTSLSYVLITFIDDISGRRHTVCIRPGAAVGAIYDQYHIVCPSGEKREDLVLYVKKLHAIALGSKGHVYHFSQADALNQLRPRYTPQMLAQVQARLKRVKTSDLIKGLADDDGLTPLYKNVPDGMDRYLDALAYVLLERGLSPRMQDISGELTVGR